MLEPPDLPASTIVARVRERYAVPVERATFLPLGNDSSAWCYRLYGGGAARFLKVLGRPVDPATVAIPRFLASRGIEHLVPAISTAEGAAFDAGDPFSFVLFPFIDAEPGGEVGLTPAHRVELGRLLRRIHDTKPTPELDAMMRRERFIVRDEAYIDHVRDALPGADPPDEISSALLAVWSKHLEEIGHSLRRARELASDGASAARELVICHADYHAWNVLVGASGALHVVDWDEVVLAPRERDLMFVSGDIADLDPTGEHFFTGYGDVEIDRALIAYYRFDWVLQEVADYHRRVFDLGLGEETRAEALQYFTELFEPENVVAAAFRADHERST
jgi:spectinomycin phosphotransferase